MAKQQFHLVILQIYITKKIRKPTIAKRSSTLKRHIKKKCIPTILINNNNKSHRPNYSDSRTNKIQNKEFDL